jgi:predicted alpha/beta superfamily hydrolase
MSILKIILLQGVLLAFSAQAETPVRIIVNTPFNTPAGNIYLTGTFPGCEWRAQCYEMQKIADNQYQSLLALPQGQYHFKVNRGEWVQEASDAQNRPLQNVLLTVGFPAKTVIQNIVNWSDLGGLRTTGDILEIKDFFSPELNNSRTLQIRLPKSYHHSKKRYPVIYMHDGQNVFNPQTSTFGVDWSVDEVLEKLESSGEVPEAIVVGIYHKDRAKEYNDEDHGESYSAFLANTLKSYIDDNFKTLSDREHTYLMGSSYGSIISFTTLWRYSHVFSKAAGLAFNGNFFKDMPIRFLSQFPNYSWKNPVSLYLDHGTEGMDGNFAPHVRRFINRISQTGMPSSQLSYRVFPYTDHTETDWARRVHIPLKFLLAP